MASSESDRLLRTANTIGLSGAALQPEDLQRMTDPTFSLSLSGEEIANKASAVAPGGDSFSNLGSDELDFGVSPGDNDDDTVSISLPDSFHDFDAAVPA